MEEVSPVPAKPVSATDATLPLPMTLHPLSLRSDGASGASVSTKNVFEAVVVEFPARSYAVTRTYEYPSGREAEAPVALVVHDAVTVEKSGVWEIWYA